MTMPSDDCERATNSDSVAGHTLVSYAIRQRPDLAMANDLMLEHLTHLRRLRRAGQVLLAVRSPGSRWVSTAPSGCSAPPTPTSSRPSSMRIPPLVGSSPPLFGHGSRSLPGTTARPGRLRKGHGGSTLRRLFVDGVSTRNAAAYFDRTYHDDICIHEAPSLPCGGDYYGLEGAARHAVGVHPNMGPLANKRATAAAPANHRHRH